MAPAQPQDMPSLSLLMVCMGSMLTGSRFPQQKNQ